MPTTVMGTEVFRREAERRLIDTFDLMLQLGLRSKQAVWTRVQAGTLPPPVINKPNIVAMWDRDEVDEFLGRA